MWIAALVVVSAFLHASWNALLRIQPDKDSAITAVMAISALIGAAIALGELALGGSPVATWTAVGWSVFAGVAEGIYFVALARGLSLGPLGPVYTISRGGAVALVWPASVLLFAEPVSSMAIAGTVVVVLGLAISGAERGASRLAVTWALVAAVCIASYHLAYKTALAAGASPAGVFAIAMLVASGASIARRAHMHPGSRVWPAAGRWRLIAIGVVCAASFLIFLCALAVGGAGHVFTLRNTSVLFATALGAVIGDRPGPRQLVGAGLVALGAALLGMT